MLISCLHLILALVTGGLDENDLREDILEYRNDDGWRKVGAMKNGRRYLSTSFIAYDQIKDKCN